MPRDPRVSAGTAVAIVQPMDDLFDGKLLMLKREGSHNAGCYAFAGGWIDYSDTDLRDAAIRELEEELGLVNVKRDELRLFTATTETHPELDDIRTVTLYFLLEHDWKRHGEPRIMEPSKCSELVWAEMGCLPTPLFPRLDEAVEALFRDYYNLFRF